MIYRRASKAFSSARSGSRAALFNGDCLELLSAIPDGTIPLTITSPPYCMGKEYEDGNDVSNFISAHEKILPEVVRVTQPGGSICWQVGYHVLDNNVLPLDYLVFDIARRSCPDVVLRNRIMWTFGHGRHSSKRFSGRHELVLWFTKGTNYQFDLDAVRIPQKYPGKRANRGPRKGEFSGNPLGKNPTDVWDIPNVKSNHIEKTEHPCQFPVALPQRLIRALSKEGDLVLDPFAGAASTGVAAIIEGRRFLGAELSDQYSNMAAARLREAQRGEAKIRPLGLEVHVPNPDSAVAQRPAHFWNGTLSSDAVL